MGQGVHGDRVTPRGNPASTMAPLPVHHLNPDATSTCSSVNLFLLLNNGPHQQGDEKQTKQVGGHLSLSVRGLQRTVEEGGKLVTCLVMNKSNQNLIKP